MDLVLLDTDILSELMKQHDPVVQQRAEAYFREQPQIAISAITCYQVLRWLREPHKAERLAQFEPEDAGAHYNLGNVLQGQGKVVAAIEHYQRALQIKPEDANAHKTTWPMRFAFKERSRQPCGTIRGRLT